MYAEKNKLIKYIIMLITLIIIIGYIVLRYPISLNREYTGLQYRLGIDNADEVKEVIVTFDGKIFKNFWLNKKFIGTIKIDPIEELLHNKEYIKELDKTVVELNFDNDMSSLLKYNLIGSKPISEFIGTIFFDHSFKEFTIQVLEPTDKDSKNWNGSDGLMITAPTVDRKDALELSNKLMKNKLYSNGEYFILE